MRDTSRRLDRVLPLLSLAFVLVEFVRSGLVEALDNWKVGMGDQNGYLRLALRVAIGDGYDNGNFHPLLAFLLSPLASREWQFYTDAKLANLVIATLAIAVVFAVGWRLFGTAPALAASAALAFSAEFWERAVRTEPEALLTGLFCAAWGAWVLSLARPRLAWLAGALAGLAYLAKGTGQFLLLGYVLYAVLAYVHAALHSRPGPRRVAPLAAFVIAYLAVASPLLITNRRVFGSPFYAFPSAHAMWYDHWEDRYATPDGRHITWRTYIATHSPAQARDRFRHGVIDLPQAWREALIIDPPDIIKQTLIALALLLGAMFVWKWIRRSRATVPERTGSSSAHGERGPTLRHALGTFAVIFGPTYVFFAWYTPIANSPRFLLPLTPIVYLLAAALADRGLRRLSMAVGDPRLYPRWREILLPAGLVLATATVIIGGEWVSPPEIAASDRQHNAAAVAVLAAIRQTVPVGGTVVWGPGNLANWSLHQQYAFVPIPPRVADVPALEAYMRRVGATTILLSPDMVLNRAGVFTPYFYYVNSSTIGIDGVPPGWHMVAAFPDDSCRYCLFTVRTE